MKKYFTCVLTVFITISALFAQVTEGIVEFNFGEHNALQINLNDVDKKLVEDAWKDYNKPLGDTDKKKGEFITKGVNLEGLSNPVDWFMHLDKEKENILLQLCVISNDEFISSTNQDSNYNVITTFLESFSYEVDKAKAKKEYEDEMDALSKLQKKLKKNNKKYKNAVDDIKKHTKNIEKTEKENKSNIKEQSKLSGKISAQANFVDDLLKDKGEESEEYLKEFKNLSKSREKLEKTVKSHEKNIKDMNKSSKKIKDAKKDSKSLKKDEKDLKDKISEQGEKVEAARKFFESMT